MDKPVKLIQAGQEIATLLGTLPQYVLIHGRAGAGKTYLSQSIAQALGRPLAPLNTNGVLGDWGKVPAIPVVDDGTEDFSWVARLPAPLDSLVLLVRTEGPQYWKLPPVCPITIKVWADEREGWKGQHGWCLSERGQRVARGEFDFK